LRAQRFSKLAHDLPGREVEIDLRPAEAIVAETSPPHLAPRAGAPIIGANDGGNRRATHPREETSMRTSTERILTTHAGSIPRPDDLVKLIFAKAGGLDYDAAALERSVTAAVEDTVARQVKIGVDVVSDGEMSKPSFLSYVTQRLGGVVTTADPFGNPWAGSREVRQYPEYYAFEASLGLNPITGMKRVACTGPLAYKGQTEVQADIARLKAAMRKSGAKEGFVPAISPTNVEFWIRNDYYPSEEAYVFALADAMHEEYKAIADSGLLLQIDDPRLVTYYVMAADQSIEDCRRWAEVRVEALNHALRGIPEEKIRFHTCYSIDTGPRTNDMELKDIVDIMVKIRAGAYSFEGANPRHEHEWKVWKDVKLKPGQVLIPGVVTHSSVLIEHPEVVCDRILRYASVVGRENVIAGADCGFGTFAGNKAIHATIAWAKLEALVKGAALASKQLFG
jgi:5-methyltetrahydropteroyltriglutamate--homocysteine methyltransferase